MIEHTKNVLNVVLIGVFTALGILGLLLPILPGLLFLFIAALMASRYFPALRIYLEQNRHTAKGLRLSNRFGSLGFWGKVRFCCWGFLKVTMEGVEWTASMIAKLCRKLKRQEV